jgi:hypothetical protein
MIQKLILLLQTFLHMGFFFFLHYQYALAQNSLPDSAEKAAVIKAIEKETDCWMRYDYACWKTFQESSDNQSWIFISNEGKTSAYIGWKQIDKLFETHFSSRVKSDQLNSDQFSKRSNIQIVIYHNDMAYVSFKQLGQLNKNYPYTLQETKVMRKINGSWKMLHSTAARVK